MRALTWHGKHDVRVETVDDPEILLPRDAIIKITSTAICGSVHLQQTNGLRSNNQPMGISTPAEIILGIIIRARSSIVDNATLARAIGINAARLHNVIQVQLSWARKIFAVRAHVWPIATQRDLGRDWIGPNITNR